MMKPRIKICGLTRLHDARTSAGLGADYLGFVQHPESPRYVEPAAAKEILSWVTGPDVAWPKTVGVFVNKEGTEVTDLCREVGFQMVQLHGHETPKTCRIIREAGIPVIKAFQVVNDASSEQLQALIEPYEDAVDHILLDTHNTSLWGGTGESFNWRIARNLSTTYSIFLAGGISSTNVAEAVETMRPFAIDVASSVEEAPGRKDFVKLGALFDAVRALENRDHA